MKGPGGQRFYDYVQNRGLSFVDAFLLTNFHRLRQRVPPEVLALFRELNPGASDAEI